MRQFAVGIVVMACAGFAAPGQFVQPLVAIHDSELTRALESLPAAAPTPSGTGTTGYQWWPTDWHYFVMPESLKEALNSDGTRYLVVGDSNIASGVLLTNGAPRFPIAISLAAEAIDDAEIAAFTNYVSAGGFLFVGSSSFSRRPDGTARGDFAFADALGLHETIGGLTNWSQNNTLTKWVDHRLTAHLPPGVLTWRMPSSSEEIPWGISPDHPFLAPHDIWRVTAADATVLAEGDLSPFLTVKRYGKGYFIYCAAFQPLMGHSGFAPSTYAYVIFRRAIEWAFESASMPIPKISPWPYPYDAALMVRHDLENFTNEVAAIEDSARFEYTNNARGDYYFCTGTLREDAWPAFDTNSMVAGLRRAVTNWGATIGPHNGGLRNPNNNALTRGEYDYWHWGTDEALVSNPPGFASGKAYATISLSNSFHDIESWLTGITNGLRSWVECYFNGTREDSYDLQAQLGVNISGDQKITPFPHWTLSTATPNKRYPFLSEPVSDWFVGGLVAQSLEPWHSPGIQTTNTLHSAVDFYYNLGALINFYSHTLSTGLGPAGNLQTEYVSYSANTNLHPRLWGANGVLIYKWWQQRSNVQASANYRTNSNGKSVLEVALAGAADTNCAVEILAPGSGLVSDLRIFTNGVLAGTNIFRMVGQTIRMRAGTSVTNAQFQYFLGPKAVDDLYSAEAGIPLTVPPPGLMANDGLGAVGGVTISLAGGPLHGDLVLGTNGDFTYTPTNGFSGEDSFTYLLTDSHGDQSTAQVLLSISGGELLFADDFSRPSEPGPVAPWVVRAGDWVVTGGIMSATNTAFQYGNAYLTTNRWADYCVKARIPFGPGAFGGGIGGRVNPVTGAHYAAWVYPEDSPGGSKVLKLVKFQDWTDFAYNGMAGAVMGQVALPAVGTNDHELKLAFRANQIAVYFDGIQMISTMDGEPQAYLQGSVSLDFWTDSISYSFRVDDVVVSPLVTTDAYSTLEEVHLAEPAPGILANDTGVYDTNLATILIAGPQHGLLDLHADGGFIYTPAAGFAGNDSFIYQTRDGVTNLGSAMVNLVVNPTNRPPILPPQNDRFIMELSELVVTNSATDAAGQALTYTLIGAPAGAMVSNDGVISWTPSESQGPSTNILTTIAMDDGTPPLSATNSFVVVVGEVNSSPILPVETNLVVAELSTMIVTNTAIRFDIPANHFLYALLNPPAGAVIDTNGVISWTPSEAQGPGTYEIAVVATDDGIPPLSSTNSFFVTVTEVNSPPSLPAQMKVAVAQTATMVVTNTATDADFPLNILTYALADSPAGATIDSNGVITWTPGLATAPGSYSFTTIVSDGGAPPLSATNIFTATVSALAPPQILSISFTNDMAMITWASVSGAAYTLQYKDHLNDVEWLSSPQDIIAVGPTTVAGVPGNGISARFFRVVFKQ